MNNYKHITLKERVIIQHLLDNGTSCKKIAETLMKSPSTISREIKRNRFIVEPPYFNLSASDICECSLRYPYVCNNCNKKNSKNKRKYFYNAQKAQENYEIGLSHARIGTHFSNKDIKWINSVLVEGLKNNQPMNHIIMAHNLPLSLSTAYRWIDQEVLSVNKIDLQKAVRYKLKPVRRSNKGYINRIDRTYNDYLDFITDRPELNIVEMDIVQGVRGDRKCILTFVCIKSNLLFSRLLNNQRAEDVAKALDYYEKTLGIEKFKKFFGVILTDNGSEFNDVHSLEFSPYTGEKRTKVFYCDPYRSDQKGTIERKHVDMRLIIPKKKSIDFLTQEKVNLMNSHINAILRPTLNNISTYEFAKFIHNRQIIDDLGIYFINPTQVVLNSSLVR